MLVTNPIPEQYSMDADVINKAINEAVKEARSRASTARPPPFLLAKIKDITGGRQPGFLHSPFEHLTMYSEVLQDSTFKLIDAGKSDCAGLVDHRVQSHAGAGIRSSGTLSRQAGAAAAGGQQSPGGHPPAGPDCPEYRAGSRHLRPRRVFRLSTKSSMICLVTRGALNQLL